MTMRNIVIYIKKKYIHLYSLSYKEFENLQLLFENMTMLRFLTGSAIGTGSLEIGTLFTFTMLHYYQDIFQCLILINHLYSITIIIR